MSEERMNEELAAVEAMLGSLTPAASNVQRDWLMFLAGRASLDRLVESSCRPLTPPHCNGGAFFGGRRFLAASLAAMTSVTAILLVMLLAQRGPQLTGRGMGPIATGPAPATETKAGDAGADIRGGLAYASYRALLRRWLADAERSRKPADIELLDELLPRGNSFAGNDSAPAVGAGTGGGPYESYERLPSLQRELDIDRGFAPALKSQPSNRKENRS